MKLSLKELKKKINKVTSRISFEWLFDKRVLVVLSVVISIVFWFYITLNVSPNEEKTFADVPVTIDAKAIDAKGMVLLDIMDTSVLGDKTYAVPVTVHGNKYSLTQIKKEDISVVAQLTNVIEYQPNNYTLALKITCTNNMYDVTAESTVESITVKLDVVSSKSFAIKTKSNSTATVEKENYTMESPGTYIGNEKITDVTVTGPQAVLSRVSAVEVFAEGAKNLKETTDFTDGRFILLNDASVQISGSDLNYVAITAIEEQFENIPVSDAMVTVRVPIRVNTEAKIVPTFTEGRVGENFNFTRLLGLTDISPAETVAIKYPPSIDADNPANDIISAHEIRTGKIDLASITPEKNVYTYSLNLPSGIELTGGLEGNKLDIDVKFDLDGYLMRKFKVNISESNFRYDADGTDMKITPSETINVTFVGPRAEILKLTEENISDKVVIDADVSNVTTEGTVSIPVNVCIKGRTNCWAVGTDEELSLSVTVSAPAI